MTTLIGLSGSLRAASTNTYLIENAAKAFGKADLVHADLRFPLYDGDLEDAKGVPAEVQKLADQIAAADAVIIASPEYNKGISGVLKNALDWVSRTENNPWSGKPVVIMSSTAGRSGGERGLTMLVSCLAPFQPRLVFGPEVLVGANYENFDADGNLTNEINIKALSNLMGKLKSII